MTLETIFQLDPKIWPIAIMALLRVVTVFMWLPLFGEQAVPARLRIALGIVFTVFLWPTILTQHAVADRLMQWSPLTLAIATMREVFFGFAVGFSARLLIFGTSIASHLVGMNMGFQTATLFSPSLGTQESSFSTFKGWLTLVLMLTFNIHHIFISGLAESFSTVAFGAIGDAQAIVRAAIATVESSCLLGLRLAAPLIAVQILITLALGLLNRAVPQLNVLVLNFPVSFVLSMGLLFVSTATFVRVVGQTGLSREVTALRTMQRAFSVAGAQGGH